jgi:hypothetical protein
MLRRLAPESSAEPPSETLMRELASVQSRIVSGAVFRDDAPSDVRDAAFRDDATSDANREGQTSAANRDGQTSATNRESQTSSTAARTRSAGDAT